MVVLFAVPPGYFVAATFLSTGCMLAASIFLGLRPKGGVRPRAILVGLASAAALYAIFLAGNSGIRAFHPLGITVSDASSIYSLIASPSNPLPLQAAVLLFDSAGYEAFFRGVLQARLAPRFGVASPFIVAGFDASIHLLTLNPLWVATTFVADSAWGLTYYAAKDLSASFVSHLAWDLAIFILLPIK